MAPKQQLAQMIIEACNHFKIKHVVISPGSRNAPLTIGFANHHTIKALSVVDERCAAFFAMGIAQQTQNPVAVVCTSGSALLNYYPAVAEAFYSKIPMIVISADRPKSFIDIGDGQTINQENVYGKHVLYSANLDESTKLTKENIKKISKAIKTSSEKKGPVHINVPFDEPLYEITKKEQRFDFEKQKINQTEKKEENKIYSVPKELAQIWNKAERKLILIGVLHPSKKIQNELNEIANNDSVLVMTETTSNLHNKKFINSIDKLISKLSEEDFKKLKPEVLVTFGGMVVSKKIKQFLRTYKPKHHWHIDEHTKLDTYFCLSQFIKKDPLLFLSSLKKQTKKVKSSYQKKWRKEKEKRDKKHKEFLLKAEYSDLKVFDVILQSVPDGCQLQLGNSSIIRYAQLFNLKNSLRVFCNRGTSGIDGSTSTAIGASFIEKKQTVFITGDISFFYDSNALWNKYIPNNFRIILVNNSGGGIFKIIPGPKSTKALKYFETPHNLKAKQIAEMFNFDYKKVASVYELKEGLTNFYKDSKRPKIMEILTPSNINDVTLQNYFSNF